LATSERSVENEHLAVHIELNGALTVTDKRTGQVYERQLTFEDNADIGDGWYHGQAVNDQVFVSTACAASVSLVHDGPYLTTFRIRTVMPLPAEFDFHAMRRSEQLVDVILETVLSLRPGSEHLECMVTVNNPARDHRLRVLFPTGAPANTYLADSPFDVVERPIALSADNHLYRELEVETRPQQSWTAVAAGGRGLAVVSAGLMESAVRDLPDRPLALTLFRATRHTVLTNDEPLGQLLGEIRFQFWLAPLAGQPDPAALCQAGQQFAAGLRDVQLTQPDAARRDVLNCLPVAAGLLRLEGPVVLTSLRYATDGPAAPGLELRVFNPNATVAEAALELSEVLLQAWRPSWVQRVDLEANPIDRSEPLSHLHANLRLTPKQIVTLRLVAEPMS
jgi:alpha-mannosidase/mannosylglycerate hydrolase